LIRGSSRFDRSDGWGTAAHRGRCPLRRSNRCAYLVLLAEVRSLGSVSW